MSLAPIAALADSTLSNQSTFADVVKFLTNIINNMLVPIVFALAFVTISWGVIKGWVIGGGSDESVAQGKSFVLVGVIAFVIMLSIWGILNFLIGGFFGN